MYKRQLLNDLQHVLYFYQLEYFLRESVPVYEKMEDEISRGILGCSIKRNMVDLKAYVNLELPGKMVVEASLVTVTEIANYHMRWVTRKSDIVNLECASIDDYWDTLVK